MEQLVLIENRGGIRIIRFNHDKPKNPFSDAMMEALGSALIAADHDDTVEAIVITGGEQRDFSVGGDFNEVSQMRTVNEVGSWIDRITRLYTTILGVSKPVVGATSGYAIGMGFQVAMLCDLRVGSEKTEFIMWELQKGLACTMGGYMLEKCVGRYHMLEMVYGCEPVTADEALRIGLLNKVVDVKDLIDESVAMARKLADYPAVPFRYTKESVNSTFIDGLYDIMNPSRFAHSASFEARTAADHFAKVLHRSPSSS